MKIKIKLNQLEPEEQLQVIIERFTCARSQAEDVYRRTVSLSTYIRLKACIELGWDDDIYYLKMGNKGVLPAKELAQFTKIVAETLKEFYEHIHNTYINPAAVNTEVL
ncbi:hypothetical protein HGH93_12125 [Chitinophaga polysaccharea]|uniref:hypothetical protein n=1 Tax=Chitinophaga polysaccharea TaxID=1293035 RepID=UPI0014552123|nr:hypothetical protein [Chitinophaga polysaccharea]NLR58854.1 hypothetical protein [Chitinophaga polysaccharea]